MTIRRLSLAGGLLLVLATGAGAFESVTSSAVNMRTGAGVGYARITTLPAGMSVQVDHCAANWCLVTARGNRGWVSAGYLGEDTAPVRATRPPVVSTPRPKLYYYDYDFLRRDYHDYRRPYEKQKRQYHPRTYDRSR